MSPELTQIEMPADWLASAVRRSAHELRGYDDVVILADRSVLASGMDGWIWHIDARTRNADPFVDVPLMPAGLRRAPDDPDIVYFCASALGGQTYPPVERVGLYSLQVSTRETRPVVLDVPNDTGASDRPTVFTSSVPARSEGTRALAFCNDLDVSADGQRIYFSEPFARADAGMGTAAVPEAIALGRGGRLWLYDRSTATTRLIARGFHFLDGVLIEPEAGGGEEQSVLITETTRYRIQRLIVAGEDAGRSEVLWDDLPGMPDGLDRDAHGNVWVGLLTIRSAASDWIHAHPWIKPLLLRLPPAMLPKGNSTGILVLDARAEQALLLARDDGSAVRDISAAIPCGEHICLASFDPAQRGLVRISAPALSR